MNTISTEELAAVEGGGWLADRVKDFLCFMEAVANSGNVAEWYGG